MSDLKAVNEAPANGKPLRRRLHVLTRRSDFLRTFRSGRKVRPCDWMIFNYVSNSGPNASFRCGWTCPKAVGGAPIRNRMKRWTRDWLQKQLKADAPPPEVDLNIGFRGMPDDFYRLLKRSEFDQAMERGWSQLVKNSRKSPLIAPLNSSSSASGTRL